MRFQWAAGGTAFELTAVGVHISADPVADVALHRDVQFVKAADGLQHQAPGDSIRNDRDTKVGTDLEIHGPQRRGQTWLPAESIVTFQPELYNDTVDISVANGLACLATTNGGLSIMDVSGCW